VTDYIVHRPSVTGHLMSAASSHSHRYSIAAAAADDDDDVRRSVVKNTDDKFPDDHFGGPVRAIILVCVSVCVWTKSILQIVLLRGYFVWWFTLILSRSRSEVKVIVNSSRPQDESVHLQL